MAPKRNRTTASSSSNPPTSPRRPQRPLRTGSVLEPLRHPTFLSQNFKRNDIESRDKYIEIYGRKSCRKYRMVDTNFLRDWPFRYYDQLQNWGFLNFLNNQLNITYEQYVSVFYANARIDPEVDNTIHTYVSGQDIVFSREALGAFLGIPISGEVNEGEAIRFPETGVQGLDAHDRFLHLMITWNFRPSSGKYSTITPLDRWWIYMFRNNYRIDLVSIVFADIHHMVTHPNSSSTLPYGWIISAFLMAQGVSLLLDNPNRITSRLGHTALTRSGFSYDPVTKIYTKGNAQGGEGEQEEEEVVPVGDEFMLPAPPVHPHQEQEQPLNFEAQVLQQLQQLNMGMTGLRGEMTTGFARFDTRFNNIDSRFDNVESRIENIESFIEENDARWEKWDHDTNMDD